MEILLEPTSNKLLVGSGKVQNEEELAFLADLGVAEGPVTQTVITHNATYQADDLDAYDSNCDEISTSKVVLMANLSSYELDVLSKVPHSKNTHNEMLNQSVQEMPYSEQTHLVNYPKNEITNDSNIIPYSQYLLEIQNAAIQDTNSSTQQDAMILSVFEQLSNQVTNCKKVNKDNLIANESLSAELESYKEWVKLLEERQNMDLITREKLIMDDIIREKNAEFANFEKEINYLKQTLYEQLKEKKLLTKTFSVLKNESKEKQAKNIDKEIALEKKVKELDNIVSDRPMLYDGTIIAKETNVISIANSEETLMLEKESQSKMLLKQSDPMFLEKKVNIKPVNYAELNRLSKDFGSLEDIPSLNTIKIEYLYTKKNNIQEKIKIKLKSANVLRTSPLRVPYDQRNNPPQHPRIVYLSILNNNYFCHFLDILRNDDPMDDEPIWAADRVVALTPGSAITIPETANEFAIKGNHLTLVKGNQFDGRTKTDPHKHIHEFLRICDMFKYRDTKNEVVRLMMFPLSLTGEAKTWLYELNNGTIETWDELRTAFISRFFPPALFN
ncbi:retrovirus-related pol polyprotein from transposon TNT 1-94 [Tanacetum coccineum]